jgi:manganese/iron transport system permease protein
MAAAVVVGVVCAVVGTYVVLRGMVFLGDALAHSILPGIALGYLVSGAARGPLFWWALGSALLSAFGIGAVSRGARIKEDTAIGIIFAGMFALGIALISTARTYAVDLAHFLFGDVLGVSAADLRLMVPLGVGIVIAVVVFYKEFLIVSFDPSLAATLRMPIRTLYYLQLALIACAIVVALQTVGVALMIAMLVTPPATACLLSHRLPVIMILGAAIGALSGVVGLYLSYYCNVASGAAVVLVSTGFFLVAFLLSPRRGLLRRRSR